MANEDLMARLKTMLRGQFRTLPPAPWQVVVTSANGIGFELEVEQSGECRLKWQSRNITGVISYPLEIRVFGLGEAGETFSKRIVVVDGGDFPSEKEMQDGICA
jgi:hypothetical protein